MQTEKLKQIGYLSREERAKNTKEAMDRITKECYDGMKKERKRLTREHLQRYIEEDAHLATLKDYYEKLVTEKCPDENKVKRSKCDWERAEHDKVGRDLELKSKVNEVTNKGNMEMGEKIRAVSMVAMEAQTSDSEAESVIESESEGESEVDGRNETMVGQFSEEKTDEEYEGIVYMKEKIKEVETGLLPGTSRQKTEAEINIELNKRMRETQQEEAVNPEIVNEVREETVTELRDVQLEVDKNIEEEIELNTLTKCEEYIQKALDIQETVVEITNSKECRKEIGRSMRKEVRNLIEIILKQQKSLIYYKVKYEETAKFKPVESKKETYVDKARKGMESQNRTRSRSRSKQRQLHTVSILPMEESSSKVTIEEVTKLVDISNLKGGVKKVRHIRKGRIIVEMEEKEDVEN